MIKRIILLLLLACPAFLAAAQEPNYDPREAAIPSIGYKGWNTLFLEWNPFTVTYTGHSNIEDDNVNFNGFSLGYSHTFSQKSTIPLFVEAGIAGQFSFGSINDGGYHDDYSVKYTLASIKVPVNLILLFKTSNTHIALMPFVGFTVRGNIWGQEKYKSSDESKTFDLFNKKERGEDYVCKRFQVGWQIGLKASFCKKLIVGASYGNDLNKIAKKREIITGTISIGFIL